jgi:hypothetical protein
MDWNPADHPRDPRSGEFTDSWAAAAADRIHRGPAWLDRIQNPDQAIAVSKQYPDTDDRSKFMNMALSDAVEMDGWASVHVARDHTAQPVGAVSSAVYELSMTHPEEPGSATLIMHLGSLQPGTGVALVRNEILRAWEAGHRAVYTEPTKTALPFWRRMGFRPDPLGLGIDEYWGIPAAEFESWIAAHR